MPSTSGEKPQDESSSDDGLSALKKKQKAIRDLDKKSKTKFDEALQAALEATSIENWEAARDHFLSLYREEFWGIILVDSNHLFIAAHAAARRKIEEEYGLSSESLLELRYDKKVAQEMAKWIERKVENFAAFSFERSISTGQNKFVYNTMAGSAEGRFLTKRGQELLHHYSNYFEVQFFDARLSERSISNAFAAAKRQALGGLTNDYRRKEAERPFDNESKKYLEGNYQLSETALTQRRKDLARDLLPSDWKTTFGKRKIFVESLNKINTCEKGVDAKIGLALLDSVPEYGIDEPPDYIGIITNDEDLAPFIERVLPKPRPGAEDSARKKRPPKPCITWAAFPTNKGGLKLDGRKKCKALQEVIGSANTLCGEENSVPE